MDLAFKELEEFFFDENNPQSAVNRQCGHVNHSNSVAASDDRVMSNNNNINNGPTAINSSSFNKIWDSFCRQDPNVPQNFSGAGSQSMDPRNNSGTINNYPIANIHPSTHPYPAMMHLPDSPPDSGADPNSPPQNFDNKQGGLKEFDQPNYTPQLYQNISRWPPNASGQVNVPKNTEQWLSPNNQLPFYPPQITEPVNNIHPPISHHRFNSSSSLKSLLLADPKSGQGNKSYVTSQSNKICDIGNEAIRDRQSIALNPLQTQVNNKIYPLLNDQLDYGVKTIVQNRACHNESADHHPRRDSSRGGGGKKRKIENEKFNEALEINARSELNIIKMPLTNNINLENTTPNSLEPRNQLLLKQSSNNNTCIKTYQNFQNFTNNGSIHPVTNQISENGGYQCIQWHPFQPSAWCSLFGPNLEPLLTPSFTVLADKGFNYSTVDESFVCQKKNHFQVTLDICLHGDPKYIKASDGSLRPIDNFVALFYGVKAESTSQIIRIEQSQSDRSKRSFQPVLLPLVPGKPFKWTIGRLHFSETTSNNMRKKGKPNPDQRYFMLIVALGARIKKYSNGQELINTDPSKNFIFPHNIYQQCFHVNHLPVRAPMTSETEDFGMAGLDNHALELNHDDHPFDDVAMIAFASEKIIVRASNPGQFDNDPEVSWQRGQGMDSICHMGNVGINTDYPDESLVVQGNIKLTGHILQPSDIRVKTNITELDSKQQLKNVSKIKVYHYRYDPSKIPGHEGDALSDTGVLAQEIEKVIPEAVKKTARWLTPNGEIIQDFLIVNKERIFMENVGAVKELTKLTGTLGNRIEKLEKLNKALPKCHKSSSFKSISGLSNSMSYTSSIMIRSTSSKVSSIVSPSRSTINSDIYKKFGTLKPDNHPSRTLKQACKKMLKNKLLQCSCAFITLIMSFCLITLSTLFVLEYMHRHKKGNESGKEYSEGIILSDPLPSYYKPSSLISSSKILPTFAEIYSKASNSGRSSKDSQQSDISTSKIATKYSNPTTISTFIPTFSIAYPTTNLKTRSHLSMHVSKIPGLEFTTVNMFEQFFNHSTSDRSNPIDIGKITSYEMEKTTIRLNINKTPTLAPYIGFFQASNNENYMGEFLTKSLHHSGDYENSLTPLPIPYHLSACLKKHHAVCPTYCCDNSSTTFYFKPGKIPKFLVGMTMSKPQVTQKLWNKELSKSLYVPTFKPKFSKNLNFKSEAQLDIQDGADNEDSLNEKPFIKTLIKISSPAKNSKINSAITVSKDLIDSNGLNFSADEYTTTQATDITTRNTVLLTGSLHRLTLKKLGGSQSKLITLTMLRPSDKILRIKNKNKITNATKILLPVQPKMPQVFEEDGEKWIRLKRETTESMNPTGLAIDGIELLELEQTLRCAPNQNIKLNTTAFKYMEENTFYSAECHGPEDQSFNFNIPLAFPFIPITLDFRLDDNAVLVLCDHYFSHMPCRRQSYLPILADDLQESKNRWRLPVGQYFWSSYRFRVARKNTFYKPLEICTWSDKYIGKTFSQSNLYFQRTPCNI